MELLCECLRRVSAMLDPQRVRIFLEYHFTLYEQALRFRAEQRAAGFTMLNHAAMFIRITKQNYSAEVLRATLVTLASAQIEIAAEDKRGT